MTMTATYSVEDNKLRLYADARLAEANAPAPSPDDHDREREAAAEAHADRMAAWEADKPGSLVAEEAGRRALGRLAATRAPESVPPTPGKNSGKSPQNPPTTVDTDKGFGDTTPVPATPAGGNGGKPMTTAIDERTAANVGRFRTRFPNLTDDELTGIVGGITPGANGAENDGETYDAAIRRAASESAARTYPAPELPPVAAVSDAQRDAAAKVRAKQLGRMRAEIERLHTAETGLPAARRGRFESQARELHARRARLAAVPDARFWLDTGHNDFGALTNIGWDAVSKKIPRAKSGAA